MNTLSTGKKIAYGIGAVGKDMVYALSANYVLYYYQDILHLDPAFVGLILMLARVFDALNDPFMGVLVAKTKSRWGRFRPWLLSGTVLNAVVLYALFAAPHAEGATLMVFFTVMYILWGVTYTMMDIPYWSMIPAVTDTPKERENLSVVGRTCAGIGAAIMQVGTLLAVEFLGGRDALGNVNEREGFRMVALIVGVLFILTEIICCLFMKEKDSGRMSTSSVKEMFSSLFHNDQALVVVLTIVLINMALYLTSNFIIYFFKYDFGNGSQTWRGSFTLFSSVGGAFQILGMMVLYPLLRARKITNQQIFRLAGGLAILGYAVILTLCLTGVTHNLILLCVPGALVFMANGVLTVLTTVFLSSSVDYGEVKTGRREESVIFSMQTFVVKAAAGVAVFLTGVGLKLINLVGDTEDTGEIIRQSAETLTGLRLMMTVLPVIGLLVALFIFHKKFRLTDEYAEQLSEELRKKHGESER